MRRRLFFALTFVAWAAIAHASTLSDLLTSVRRNVRDTATDVTLQRYSDATITTLINEGQSDVAFRTWLVEKSSSITVVANIAAYLVPTDFIVDAHVYRTVVGVGFFNLEKKTRIETFEDSPDWQVTPATPTAYWISDNLTGGTRARLNIAPTPDTPTSGETVVLHYYSQPADLAAGTDVPFDGQLNLYQYHKVLSYYATADIFLREENIPMAEYYEKRYESVLEEISDRLGRVQNSPKFASPEKK